jgi:hypothetical protein
MQLTATIPTTIPAAIEQLYSKLDQESIDFIKKNDSSSIHFGTGMSLCNNWHLWDKESPLNIDFRQRYNLFGHADDISELLYNAIWAKVRGKNIEKAINDTVTKYRKHWAGQGLNPLTGRPTYEAEWDSEDEGDDN